MGEFLETPSGAEHLQRLVTAAVLVIEYGSSGVRGLQEYLHHSGLDQQMEIIKGAANEAGLSQNCMERIAKAGRAFDAMVSLMTSYLLMLGLYVNKLQSSSR